MDVNKMTRREFDALSDRKWDEDIGEFDSLVVLPMNISYFDIFWYWMCYFVSKIFRFEPPEIWQIRGMHDSGYRCMDFVACKDNEPICKLSGCSDVVHFNGIGGCGYNWLERYKAVPDKIPPIDWNIDCLLKSGLLRIFCQEYKLKAGEALSSFELFAISKKEI